MTDVKHAKYCHQLSRDGEPAQQNSTVSTAIPGLILVRCSRCGAVEAIRNPTSHKEAQDHAR